MYIKSEKLLQFENEYESYSYNPISCNICYKTFAAKSTLQLHIEIHHETNSNTEKEIQNYKDSKIIKEIVFVKSEQKDMEDENFIVNECDSQVGMKNILRNHLKNFKAENFKNRFKCMLCPKSFISQSNSKKHIRNEKINSWLKLNLKRHMFQLVIINQNKIFEVF